MKINEVYQKIIDFANQNEYFLLCSEDHTLPGYIIHDRHSSNFWIIKVLGSGVIPEHIKLDLMTWNSPLNVISSFVSCLNHRHGFNKKSAEECSLCLIKDVMDS